jgi:hypothetical protein
MPESTPQTNPEEYDCSVTNQTIPPSVIIKNKRNYGITVFVFVLLILCYIIMSNMKSIVVSYIEIKNGAKNLTELTSSISKNTMAIFLSLIMCIIFIIMYSINEL